MKKKMNPHPRVINPVRALYAVQKTKQNKTKNHATDTLAVDIKNESSKTQIIELIIINIVTQEIYNFVLIYVILYII